VIRDETPRASGELEGRGARLDAGPSPRDDLSATSAALLAGGTAIFLVADAVMLRILAAVQVAALVAVVASGLAADAYGRQPPGSGSPTLTPKRSISSGTVSGRISSP